MGNVKGWTLAALLVVAEIVGVWLVLRLDQVSPPTALATAALTRPLIIPAADPRTVVRQDQPGDAGVLIRRAVDAYLADAGRYEAFQRDRNRASLSDLPALDPLVAATHLAAGMPYAETPEAVVVYGESAMVTAMERLGKVAITAGLLLEKREPARATAYYEAAFSVGARMVQERLTYREFAAGVELMSTAGACLADQFRKARREEDRVRVQSFLDAQRKLVTEQVFPTIEAIATMNEQKIAMHAGDVFALATGAADRMWRIEATLKLGRMRFNVGQPPRPSDQRQAERLVRKLAASDPDPIVRRAATLARDLTVEEFRTLR